MSDHRYREVPRAVNMLYSRVMDAVDFSRVVETDIEDDQLNIDSQDCMDRLPEYDELEYKRMMNEDMPCLRCIHCDCIDHGEQCQWCKNCKCGGGGTVPKGCCCTIK
jgi:hypothetical protein